MRIGCAPRPVGTQVDDETPDHAETADDAETERGASFIIVLVCLTAIIGLGGLAIESGRLWSERRALVTATDAGASAAAAVYGAGGDGCTEARVYVELNAPQNTSFTCDVTLAGNRRSGVVEVHSSTTVNYGLGQILGLESGVSTSSTAAMWGRQIYRGIRPFAFCADGNPDLQAWLSNPVDEVVVVITLDASTNVDSCTARGGRNPGNWGLLDFDGGANSTGAVGNWIESGYDGDLFTSSSTTPCSVDPVGCIDGNPGVLSSSLQSELETLSNLGTVPFIIYRGVEGQGANLTFRAVGVAPGELIDFQVRGAQASRSLTIRFEPGFVSDNWDADAKRVCGQVLADCIGLSP